MDLWALFASSFLAATILPFAAEIPLAVGGPVGILLLLLGLSFLGGVP
jgi:membrane protein YqaA with SNARE-associated domain